MTVRSTYRAAVSGLVLWALGFAGPTMGVAVRPEAIGTQRPLLAILCYHDLSEAPNAPATSVAPEVLRAQIRDFKASGWTFLRLSEVTDRVERGEPLPRRAIVLTFDDGYLSFLDHALPILREEQVPATLSIIGAFVEQPPPDMPRLLSWEQIREVEASGWVEIASHSYDLHRWATNNPYRDSSPSVTTRRYLLEQKRYEDRDEYRTRIRQDMAAAQENLRLNLGHEASVYAWPYGENNEMVRALAAEAGFKWTLALGARAVEAEDLRSGILPRVMVTRIMRLGDDLRWMSIGTPDVRAAQVDLDPIYDPDVQRFRSNVDALVARLRAAGATHVILQACPDPKGNGKLTQTYFVNHQVEVKADIWSMVAAKLHQAGMQVWIRGPVLNLSWAWKEHPEWRISRDRKLRPRNKGWYYRLSPDLPEVRQAARDFYADVAVYLPIDGVLFDDDAYMLPDEALKASGVTDPRVKSEAMREMIDEIMRTVRAWRPHAQFGRNIYARAAEHEGVYAMFAQDLGQFLRDYDYTVVMAYAHMEGHRNDAPAWIRQLVGRTLKRWTGAGPAPVMFKLQAYDWVSDRWLGNDDLARQALEARRAGALYLGVYPVFPAEGPLPDGLLSAPVKAPGRVGYSQPALRKRRNRIASTTTIRPMENG